MSKVTRRTVLAGMGATAAAAALHTVPAMAQDRRIRHFWWGNPERDRRTFAVIDIFKAHHPEIDVSGETIGWSDYWTKMATQTAGGNMADLVQMDYRYLFEYVRRGALLPLDEYFGKTLNLDGFDQSALDGGMVDGKLYALNIGSNSQVGIYNTAMLKDAGVEFEPIGWTYDDLVEVSKTVVEATPDGVYGTDDLSAGYVFWEDYTQQRGKRFYSDDGSVGTTPDILADYWKFWAEMRKSGLVTKGENTVGLIGSSMVDTGLVTKTSAFSYMWSNQIVGIQSLMEDTVGAAMLPKVSGATMPGQFIKPSMFMSLTRDTKDADAATMYMNDWVNDPEATAILGLERGIPANPVVREALAPSFTAPERVSVDYFNAIQGKVGALPPPPPKGAGEVNKAFERWATQVLLDKVTPEDAAKSHLDEAADILFRAS